ncbi:MAG: hypothetical protein FJW20_26835, partial [Acidimicrobiia bacterium]|nr:hypothetical protein [Acidimicrobiia bacterium]
MSEVLDFIRKQEPRFRQVSDEDLTRFVGEALPEFLQDPDFKTQYDTLLNPPSLRPGRVENAPSRISRSDVENLIALTNPDQADSLIEVARKPLSQHLKEVAHDLMTPLVSLPRLESGELQTLGVPETPAKVLAGAQRGVINATEFFLSPLGIATLGIGGLPSAAQRAIAGAFAVDMARQTPEIFAQLGEAVGTEDLERATELTVTGAANTLFAGKSAAHALGVGRLPLAGQIGKEMLRYIRSPEMDAALRSQVDASARQALDQGVRVEVIREADSAERARLRAQGLDILEPGEVRPGTPAEVQTTEGIAIVRAPAMGEMPRYAGEFEGQPIERGERTPPAPPPAKPAAPQPVDMLRIPPKPPARVFEASTPGAQSKVSGVYDVVEARDLVTSFDPGYDAALQPRDRSRQASANQITTLAQRLEPQRLGESPTTDMGAPIVDERNQLLSGNGRTEALRMLYGSEGGAAPYKDYLVRNADRFGLTPEQVAGMNQPVLVRRVSDYGGLSKEEFARQSNQQQVLGMGEVEFAASDARLLAENPALRDSFAPGEDGNLLAATNRDFLNRFIQATGSQAELLTKEGYNAPAVIRRVKNAILAGLIGPENRTLISRMIEGAEELNIKISVNGLMTASPALFRLKGTAYDLSTLIEQAMKDQVALRHSGQKLEEFLSQANLFGEPGRSAASDQLLTFLAKARSVKQVSEALARYQRAAENAIADAQSGGMFGLRPATREELLQRIYERQTSPAQENLPTGKPPPTAGGAPGSGAEAPLADPVATERLREAPERKPLADPLQSPAPPGAPTAQLFDQRLPVTLTQTTQAAPVSVPEIMRSLEDVVRAAGGQAPIRTGRMGAHARTARGFFKPFQEVIRIKQADNIPTATHEVAHALQKELFGSSKSKALFGLPVGVTRELVALGQALYGSRKPAAGYTAEGWAEFVRHWLTTEDAPRLAPQTLKLFEAEILAKNPAVARALRLARDKIEVYRAQGAVERAKVQMVRSPGVVKRIERAIRDFFTARNHVDEFEPLYQISVGYRDITGKSLSPAADPFLLATWKRGTAGTVVEAMVERGMQDIWGNPTGGGSLREALAPVRNRQEDFTLYIWARRAVERWSQGKNPGITREDAEFLLKHFDSPKFQLAAQKYYEWNAGVMEYLREANPAMGPLIDAIKAASKDYAPLARVIDPKEATAAAVAARANPLYRMKGSGRQVRDIWETTLENTARLVSLAHRNMILNSIVKLSKAEGMGYLVEQVPRDRVPEQFNFDLVRQQLEEMGVDTSLIDANTTLTYFTMATKPKGLDPIVAVKDMTEIKWYYVAPEVYEVLNGLQMPRLGPIADLFLGMPARAFRLGTTGLRASFSLVTNPLRDLRTFV